jgi:amidase
MRANMLSASEREKGSAMARAPDRDELERRLDRIATSEASLRAYAHFDADSARAAADALARRGDAGPLAGRAVAVKDIFDTVDMPTGRGSPIYANCRPERDSAAVAAIRSAGGIVVGKSVTTEFAFMNPGSTVNPHDATRTPGGSSSGSAATVAAGGAQFATGTQTAGSIIRPAAFCGVVGFKPSFGAVSRSGLALFSETLDTVGGFAQTAREAALFVGVMAGREDLFAVEAASAAPRIGVYRAAEWGVATPEAHAALEHAAQRLSAAGAHVSDIDLPVPCRGLLPEQDAIMAFDGAAALAWEATARADALSPVLRDYLTKGRAMEGADHARRLARVALARGAAAALFDDFDAILTLSAPGEAPKGLASTGDSSFNRVWTLLGLPAMHLPFATGPAGMPLGAQLIGRMWGEADLAATAIWAERVLEPIGVG